MAQASNELFSVEFFELQLRFAERVAELGEVSLAQAVESHTNIRVRLAMGQLPDAGKADWRDYLARLATAHDKAAWTHAVHVGRLHLSAGPALTHVEGCFACALIGPDRARLHFHAGDGSAGSPLSAQNRSVRQRELGLLFSKLKAMSPQSTHVVVASWLYNLPSYRRLFPEPYLASLRPIANPYQRMPLWGQFLTRDRRVRPEARARFLDDIARASTLSELDSCFPFSVLTTTSPVTCFDAAQLER